MVAGAPLERAHRIAVGQVFGFAVLVAVAAAAAAVLFEFSTAVVGLLGLVPLAIGVRGLVGLSGPPRGRGRDEGPRQSGAAARRARSRGGPEPHRGRTGHHRRRRRQPGRLHPPLPGRRGDQSGAIAAVFVVGEVAVTAARPGRRSPPEGTERDDPSRAPWPSRPAVLHRRAGHGGGGDVLAAVRAVGPAAGSTATTARAEVGQWRPYVRDRRRPHPRPPRVGGARAPPLREVMEAWRTSCPRLPVWEDANDRGFIARHHELGAVS